MRKLLETYLETKRLFEETTKAFEGETNEDLRKAAVEIAESELRTARQQFAAAIQQNGLPSVEASLVGARYEPHRRNEALAAEWLQEKADREQRAQYLHWREGETLRATPKGMGSPGFVLL